MSPSFLLTRVVRHPQSTTEDAMAGNIGVLLICHKLGVCIIHTHILYMFFSRYFYAISSDVAIKHPGRLVKVDTQTSKVSPCRLVYKYMLNGNYLIGKG